MSPGQTEMTVDSTDAAAREVSGSSQSARATIRVCQRSCAPADGRRAGPGLKLPGHGLLYGDVQTVDRTRPADRRRLS
jgi:hypothetical protein